MNDRAGLNDDGLHPRRITARFLQVSIRFRQPADALYALCNGRR
jgi:hypothetical protein